MMHRQRRRLMTFNHKGEKYIGLEEAILERTRILHLVKKESMKKINEEMQEKESDDKGKHNLGQDNPINMDNRKCFKSVGACYTSYNNTIISQWMISFSRLTIFYYADSYSLRIFEYSSLILIKSCIVDSYSLFWKVNLG